jgi:hypothetical protein
LSAAAENARKIRNAIKFILGTAYRADTEPRELQDVQLGLVRCLVVREDSHIHMTGV